VNIILFEENEVDEGVLPLTAQPAAHVLIAKRDPRAIHLIKVLHKKMGGSFDAGVIGGKRGRGTIESTLPDGSLAIRLELNEKAPDRLPIHIAIGFPRPIQLRRILRELSNMGVGEISLFGTDLGEKSYRDTTLFSSGGARAALVEGAAQSRDTLLPTLRIFPSLDEWLAAIMGNVERRMGNVSNIIAADNIDPDGSFADLLRTVSAAPPLASTPEARTVPCSLIIGCERGWSERERTLFKASGVRRLSLGERALKTETACVVAAALFANLTDSTVLR
jgi:RsmE family RNA methyltransferase